MLMAHIAVRQGGVMCYPFFEECQQRRVDNRRLRKMGEHFAMGRRWDVTKGVSPIEMELKAA